MQTNRRGLQKGRHRTNNWKQWTTCFKVPTVPEKSRSHNNICKYLTAEIKWILLMDKSSSITRRSDNVGKIKLKNKTRSAVKKSRIWIWVNRKQPRSIHKSLTSPCLSNSAWIRKKANQRRAIGEPRGRSHHQIATQTRNPIRQPGIDHWTPIVFLKAIRRSCKSSVQTLSTPKRILQARLVTPNRCIPCANPCSTTLESKVAKIKNKRSESSSPSRATFQKFLGKSRRMTKSWRTQCWK